jgi:hydroxyethylthiazole kinase
MLISPPFLPARIDHETDSAWLDRAMREVEDGAYPVGRNLCWHGGVHLEAPVENGQILPVRAIADGIVRFRQDAQPRDNNPQHALAYEVWTSDGVVVIEHNTDIGATTANDTSITVRYFSIYQHLIDIPQAIQTGRSVYRKEELGQAGEIAGQPDRIHFEIVCDDANLERLIGRRSGTLPVDRNGRNEAVFGEIHIRLLAGTPVYTVPQGRRLADNHAVAHTVAAGAQPDDPQPLTTNAVTPMACYIGLRYAMGDGAVADRGNLTVSTYRADGTVCGERHEAQAEYQIYTRANAISQAYPDNSRPAPSAVYELLRFGRVINRHETLAPADVPHWREIVIPSAAGTGTQTGWVNLNNQAVAQRVTVFSDADFPDWRGWRIFDDDISPENSRCDSDAPKQLLDIDGDHHVTPVERQTRMRDEATRLKMRKAICTIPSEWNAADLQAKWSWLRQSTEENPTPLTEEDYNEFIAHATALSFTVPEAATAVRRFHPRGFVEAFRKCGWLSLDEFAEIYPNSTTANRSRYILEINKCCRKYLITGVRAGNFFGQAGVESSQLRLMSELYNGNPFDYFRNYEKAKNYAGWLGNILHNDGGNFRGRGLKQMTGRSNYCEYWLYRGWISSSDYSSNWWRNLGWWGIQGNYIAALHSNIMPIQNQQAITNLMQTMNPPQINNPEIITGSIYNCIDSAGWFWAKNNLLPLADDNNHINLTNRIRGDHATTAADFPAAAHFPQRRDLSDTVRRFLGDQP